MANQPEHFGVAIYEGFQLTNMCSRDDLSGPHIARPLAHACDARLLDLAATPADA